MEEDLKLYQDHYSDWRSYSPDQRSQQNVEKLMNRLQGADLDRFDFKTIMRGHIWGWH